MNSCFLKKKKEEKKDFCGFFTDVSPANKEQKQIKTAVITMLTSVLALISPGLGTLM